MSKPTSTVIVDQYRKAASSPAGTNSYAGLRIHALPGLHEFLADLVCKFVGAGSTILDLAAGSGAMSKRMIDLGYTAVASDYVSENFKPTEIPFIQANLNDEFAGVIGERSFKAILASEIVEHLENPRHFLRQCQEILDDEGIIVLSTPNLQSSGSIASFIRSGQFLWFSDLDYKIQGHITPISSWQLGHCLVESGFRLVWSGSFGTGSSKMAGSPRLNLLARVIDLLTVVPSELRGEVYVCIAQKNSDRSQSEA